jgi:hypothetical protein
MTRRAELTIDDLLSDPLTLALMAADGVDPIKLRSALRMIGRRLGDRKTSTGSPGPGTPWLDGDLLRDCIHFSEASPTARRGAAEDSRPAASRTHRSW